MDNRLKSIEHQVGVFPWPGHEEEDPEQPNNVDRFSYHTLVDT